ncbi:ABC transporter ATP-binding protein [Corticibacter populi]|uniref:ABC transporter ATP-binding protein n=1 Tax=Corticibacter populi TaxID=1550736 RepID=A0A3M6QPA1_9BURK|nr:ABC transporter ATP-binding protein [Corticibacter populi]RMX04890.1 ABC transporter ATP-binding protein [Corticibacter populi]RZS33687.1 NitT/TauT family transport system ATP-binding protein [Corticibacter populi]
MNQTVKIRLESVGKSFAHGRHAEQTLTVLEGVSLDVLAGEFVCLLGPSGCGKSTILNLLAGFERQDQGRLSLDGRPIQGPSPQRGMVFQQPNLFPWLTVLQNVVFGPRMARQAQQDYLPAARHYLQQIGLEKYADHYPWQLSGGMRQRVALARAWLPGPQVLLMDEPFGALDAQTRLVMQDLLNRIWAQTGTTIVFVTHDVDEALFLADRIVLMSAHPGRVREIIDVPFARPRRPDALFLERAYAPIKKQILQALREESSHMLGQAPLELPADAPDVAAKVA